MRKFKILSLAAIVIGIGATTTMTGCTKNNNTTTVTKDSVFSSGWIAPVTPLNPNDSLYEQTFSNAAITQAVVSNGVVLTYLGYVGSIGGSTGTDTVGEIASDYGIYTTFSVGKILIQSLPTYDGGLGDLTNSGALFRYVIIPGSVLASTKLTPKELKSMNYTEVTKLLGSTTAQQAAPGSLSTQ